MAALECVGGPWDGEFVEVGRSYDLRLPMLDGSSNYFQISEQEPDTTVKYRIGVYVRARWRKGCAWRVGNERREFWWEQDVLRWEGER